MISCTGNMGEVETMKTKRPPLRRHIGDKVSWEDIRGKKRYLIIVDEIIRIQANAPHKAIYLQKMRYPKENRYEFRLCYFMIGVKGRTKGEWVFGQYATLIPKRDFKAIITRAKKKGWIL